MATVYVDILTKDVRFTDMLKDVSLDLCLSRVCNVVYAHFEGGDGEISVVLSDDAFIQDLNKQYRGKDQPTNVLSFVSRDAFTKNADREMLGDIIVAYDTVAREAQEQNKTFYDHFIHLIVHGTLHLLGMDHIDSDDAQEMEELECICLHTLGIANPYKDTIVIQ